MRACEKCRTPYPAGQLYCDLDGYQIVEAADPLEDTGASGVTGSLPSSSGLFDSDIDVEEPGEPVLLRDERLGSVLGSYRVLDLIGEGGMGRVYLAEHLSLGRRVAIKVLRAKYASKAEIVQRFFLEARAVNQIRHPNIVDVTDFVSGPGGTYFVMELLSGLDLGALMKEVGALPVGRGISIISQVCEALAAAHRHGIVHRDLKPDNVFLIDWRGQKDFVKVLDFGVAKLGAALARARPGAPDDTGADPHVTHAGVLMGTPAYMSPEQSSGGPIDARCDVYSLGAIMFKVFAGRSPFRAASVDEYARAHRTLPPPSPRKYAPSIPEALERVILTCLEKDPARRFQSMDELRHALSVVEEDIAAARLGADEEGRSASASVPVVVEEPKPSRRARWPWVLVAVVLLGGAAAGGLYAAGLVPPGVLAALDVLARAAGWPDDSTPRPAGRPDRSPARKSGGSDEGTAGSAGARGAATVAPAAGADGATAGPDGRPDPALDASAEPATLPSSAAGSTAVAEDDSGTAEATARATHKRHGGRKGKGAAARDDAAAAPSSAGGAKGKPVGSEVTLDPFH